MARNLDKQVNVKFPVTDLERIQKISERFGLEKSEVVRRSLREGLRSFEDARIPGSPRDNREKGV